jgi:dienelactone hydrolase
MIRAIYRAIKVSAAAPHDTLTLKLFYPAAPTGSEEERMSGVIAADAAQAPFPVVVFMPGVNVEMACYQWLAVRLAQTGLVVVTYNWVAEDLPGYVSLTPGVNLAAFQPDTYGQQPTTTALPAILNELAIIHDPSRFTHHASHITPLTGLLNLNTIILGGHSAGGTIALQNGRSDYFPQVTAVFSYAAHTMASTMLGYPPETILPLANDCPCLIMGGTNDGVIAASGGRYASTAGSTTAAIERTFHEGVTRRQGDSYLALLDGANHFTMAYPLDETTGRPFLDQPSSQPDDQLRDLLANLISQFIEAHARRRPNVAKALQMENELLALFERK